MELHCHLISKSSFHYWIWFLKQLHKVVHKWIQSSTKTTQHTIMITLTHIYSHSKAKCNKKLSYLKSQKNFKIFRIKWNHIYLRNVKLVTNIISCNNNFSYDIICQFLNNIINLILVHNPKVWSIFLRSLIQTLFFFFSFLNTNL